MSSIQKTLRDLHGKLYVPFQPDANFLQPSMHSKGTIKLNYNSSTTRDPIIINNYNKANADSVMVSENEKEDDDTIVAKMKAINVSK